MYFKPHYSKVKMSLGLKPHCSRHSFGSLRMHGMHFKPHYAQNYWAIFLIDIWHLDETMYFAVKQLRNVQL